jgi:hypothetical protein
MLVTRGFRLSGVLGAAVVAAACAGAQPVGEPSLDDLRSATERFRDVNVALAEGYLADDKCVTAEMIGAPAQLGAMGIHYLNPGLLGMTGVEPRVTGTGTHTDFRRPAILIYEPQADGSLELVGVENLVFRDTWRAAGHHTPPTFHGVEYDEMADDAATEMDEAHGFEPHYDLHIWLFRQNPAGTFAPFNPAVSCQHFDEAVHHRH